MKNNIHEVEQPRSEGEKNFKGLHNPVNHTKLVPGVTDQDHVFKGSTQPYDNKYPNSNKPGQDVDGYDKNLRVDGNVNKDGYEKSTVGEETLSAKAGREGKDLGKPGKNFAKIAKVVAARYGSKAAGEKVAGAILAKMRALKETNHVAEGIIGSIAKAAGNTIDTAFHLPGNPDKLPDPIKMSSNTIKTLTPKTLTPNTRKTSSIISKVAKSMKKTHAEEVSMNEDGYDDTPEEVSMVRTELKAIIADAQGLLDNMSTDMHIEPWVQSKIAVAKSMINGVHDYMLFSDDVGEPADVVAVMPMSAPTTYGNFINRMGEEVEKNDEKSLAALAKPKDKITKKDILFGRGVLTPDGKLIKKEEVDIEIKSPALKKAFERKL
jgi:hypothetical protein